MQQVLLHRRRKKWQGKEVFQGRVTKAERVSVEEYEMALDEYKDMATNRGFRMKDGAMYTYEQHKLGLSAYYDKRWVLEDGIHTEPI